MDRKYKRIIQISGKHNKLGGYSQYMGVSDLRICAKYDKLKDILD